MMFKIIHIQAMDSLSDERAEFFINDRMCFLRFLGPGLLDRVPTRGRSGCYLRGFGFIWKRLAIDSVAYEGARFREGMLTKICIANVYEDKVPGEKFMLLNELLMADTL